MAQEVAGHGFRAIFTANVSRRLSAALRSERSVDDRLVRVHVDDVPDADARRLDDVDGVDADAWTDMAGLRGIIRWHVVRDDGGYFFVWTVFGIVVFPLGAALAEIVMQRSKLARVVPIAVSVVVVIAGALQFSAWKAHHLACCREMPGHGCMLPADAGTAWRDGLRLGLRCIYTCAGLTAILLVIGIMDLRVMALVTAAITAERLAPKGERVARAIGIVVVGVGLLMIARAAAGLE